MWKLLQWLAVGLLWFQKCHVHGAGRMWCSRRSTSTSLLPLLSCFGLSVCLLFCFFFDSGSHESELQLDRSAFGWEGRLCAYHPVCKAVLVLWEYKVGYFYKNSLYDSWFLPQPQKVLESLEKTRNVTARLPEPEGSLRMTRSGV